MVPPQVLMRHILKSQDFRQFLPALQVLQIQSTRFRARLVSAGLSNLLISTATTEDINELWGVDDSSSSASISVDPGCRIRLLLELSLESTLASKRLDRGPVSKKGGIEDGPKVNWAVSSRADSSAFMCLWKTPFSQSKPLGL